MPSPPPPQRTPWASVVRGGDSENTTPTAAEVEEGLTHEAQSESLISTQDQDEVNVGRSRRPVWNRPNNVVVEAGESVMGGAVAWPALSESARTGGSRQVVADGSASASSTQAPILSQPPQRSANNNGTHGNSTGNNSASNNRQRSRNRGGGGGGNRPSAPMTQPPPPPPPPQPIFPIYERPYLVPASAIDAPVRSQRPAGGSQSQMGSEHASSQRNNSRRGNYNPRPRGDGSFHNNHGNRRDQDRRGFHPTLPLYVHPPPVGYMPPPPPPPPLPLAAAGATSFMVSPQQMRAFPIFGVEMPQGYVIPSMPPDPYRPTMPPPPPPPPPMLYPPANENSLEFLIINQINYYFSDYNLATDDFLRSNMDDSGWVPISLIASFRRVQILTNDIQVILNALRDSPLLEIQGDKVRRRSNWIRWLPSSGSNSSNPGSSQTLASASEDASSKSMQNMPLDDSSTSTNNGEENNATESHYKLRLANGEDASEANHLIGV